MCFGLIVLFCCCFAFGLLVLGSLLVVFGTCVADCGVLFLLLSLFTWGFVVSFVCVLVFD